MHIHLKTVVAQFTLQPPMSVLKGFKDILTFISHCPSLLVQCFTSLAQAVTLQTETKKLLKRDFIVIIHKYLLEFSGFRMNLVYFIQKNYNIDDK